MKAYPGTLELLVRGATCTLGGLLGLGVGRWLLEQGVLTESINLIYLTLLGFLIGYLLSPPLVRGAERLRRWLRVLPPGAVLAAGLGATAALILTVLLNSVLERIPGFSWQLSVVMTVALVGASSWFFVANRHLLGQWQPADSGPESPQNAPLATVLATVLDTSALIDGRVVAVAEANFLAGRVLLPDMVLFELQGIADSGDPARRRRGRRGLEIVTQLGTLLEDKLELVHDTFGDEAVDAKLVKLSAWRAARGCSPPTTTWAGWRRSAASWS